VNGYKFLIIRIRAVGAKKFRRNVSCEESGGVLFLLVVSGSAGTTAA